MKLHRCILIAFCGVFLFSILGTTLNLVADDSIPKKIKIGYIESEEYSEFSYQLDVIAQSLTLKGYLTNYDGVKNNENSLEVWNEICNVQTSNKVEFVQDAYYSMNGVVEKDIYNRDDIDLYITMGTVAGAYLNENEQSNFDYMIFASGSPKSAGLIDENNKPVNSNCFVHIDSNRYLRQIEVAKQMLNFEKIGVVYEDTVEAYSYSGIAQLEESSEKFGFEIYAKNIDEPNSPYEYEAYYQNLKAAYKELIPQIDALYITTASIEDDMLSFLLEDVHNAKIPTIAQSTESQVENGALINISINNVYDEGFFAADQIHKYINGKKISELQMVFESTPKIALNYNTCKKIEFKIPMETLLIVDEIYN